MITADPTIATTHCPIPGCNVEISPDDHTCEYHWGLIPDTLMGHYITASTPMHRKQYLHRILHYLNNLPVSVLAEAKEFAEAMQAQDICECPECGNCDCAFLNPETKNLFRLHPQCVAYSHELTHGNRPTPGTPQDRRRLSQPRRRPGAHDVSFLQLPGIDHANHRSRRLV
jgi:hypothetical protein